MIQEDNRFFGFGGFFVCFGLGFLLFCLRLFYCSCLVFFFPVGISPVNDTVVPYVYKILSSITVQHILFFTSYALIHCSPGPQLDTDKKCKNT